MSTAGRGDMSPFSGELARMHGEYLPRGPDVADLDLPLLGGFAWDPAGTGDFPMTPDFARTQVSRAGGHIPLGSTALASSPLASPFAISPFASGPFASSPFAMLEGTGTVDFSMQ